MNKIYLHIGPPKTATTSLQYWLKDQKFNHYSYEGVIQPREPNSTCLSNMLLSSVLDKKQNFGIENEIRNRIKYKSLIISEESFTVVNNKLEWENSLTKLFSSVSTFNPTIIICLREPKKAIRSYYQEVFHMLPYNLQQDVNEFASSDWCFPFDYRALTDSLLRAGFTDIKYISFDRLVLGEYVFSEIFGGNDERKIVLSRENISKKKGSRPTSNNKVSLYIYLREALPKGVVSILKKIRITKYLPDLKCYKRFDENDLIFSLEKRFEQNYLHYLEKVSKIR